MPTDSFVGTGLLTLTLHVQCRWKLDVERLKFVNLRFIYLFCWEWTFRWKLDVERLKFVNLRFIYLFCWEWTFIYIYIYIYICLCVKQGRCHLKPRVVLRPPWTEFFYFFVYNNLKFLFVYPSKNILETPSVFFYANKIKFCFVICSIFNRWMIAWLCTLKEI